MIPPSEVALTRAKPSNLETFIREKMVQIDELDHQAAVQDMRLKRCGLVFHENQLDGHRWVSPPAGRETEQSRIKVLPLYMVNPTPGLEITATDGERYLLPADFKGDWFAIRSPKGVPLTGE